MAIESKIGWTGSTWTPWIGCTKVSAGCDHCYMFRQQERWGKDPTVVRRSKTTFKDPLKWAPSLIFTCSLSDWFHEDADAHRAEAWGIVNSTPQHRYQILTKRPQRMAANMPLNKALPNVWLGVSVENNKALSRIRYFDRLAVAGYTVPVRFVSFEPLIEKINLARLGEEFNRSPYEWAIIGGESGFTVDKYRECRAEWIAELVHFHNDRGVAVFVKQTGTYLSKWLGLQTNAGTDLEHLPLEYQMLNHQSFPADFYDWAKTK